MAGGSIGRVPSSWALTPCDLQAPRRPHWRRRWGSRCCGTPRRSRQGGGRTWSATLGKEQAAGGASWRVLTGAQQQRAVAGSQSPDLLPPERRCDCEQLVMVGDRFLTDVVFGNRNGMLTIRPAPFTSKGEPRAVLMVRRRLHSRPSCRNGVGKVAVILGISAVRIAGRQLMHDCVLAAGTKSGGVLCGALAAAECAATAAPAGTRPITAGRLPAAPR